MLIFLQTIKKILLKIKLHTTRCSRTAIEICQESETNTRILFFLVYNETKQKNWKHKQRTENVGPRRKSTERNGGNYCLYGGVERKGQIERTKTKRKLCVCISLTNTQHFKFNYT